MSTPVQPGMFLLCEDHPPSGVERPVRYDLWAVKSVRQLKTAAKVTLVQATDSCNIEATATFPGGEVRPPFKVFKLSQSDLKLVWEGRGT